MPDPLVVLHVLPDLAVGGGQVLLLRQISAASAGVKHHVAFVVDKRDMEERFRAAGAVCHFVPSDGALGFVRAGRAIAELAKAIGAGVIHTNNTGLDRRPGMIAAERAELPLVNTLHAEGASRESSRGGGVKGVVRAMLRGSEDRLAANVTRGVVAVSHHVLNSWQWRLDQIGIAAGSVRVIHPGLDLARFDGAAAAGDGSLRRRLLKGRAGPLLVHVGRIAAGKGHRDLIGTIAALRVEFPGVVMLCVGDGPDRAVIESEVAAAGLAEHFHFAGDRADVPAILRVSDLMLFPSHSEGFGLAPLEAMAAGIAVVSYSLPSVAEFLGEGGLMSPVGDSGAMAGAAAMLLRDPARLRAMGAAGRRTVEGGFTVARFVEQHELLYRELARENVAGRNGTGNARE